MIFPPSKVSPGEKVTAAHHNALLDYVLRTTPRAGRNTTITEKPNGCFINAQPGGGGGGGSSRLFPFAVRVIEDPDEEPGEGEDAKMCIAIYLPTYAVYLGAEPAEPTDTIASIPDYGEDWQKIIRASDGMPVDLPQADETVVVHIALGRKKDEENHITVDATRLLVEKVGDDSEGDEEEDDDDFSPTAKIPVASIWAESKSSLGGEAKIVYHVTQYLYSALAWPKPEERPWTWDPALKGWRNTWYQSNRSVQSLPGSVANEDLEDGRYYLKITLADNSVDLVRRGDGDSADDFTSDDDTSFFFVGTVKDGEADESDCPHHIPIEIHYE